MKHGPVLSAWRNANEVTIKPLSQVFEILSYAPTAVAVRSLICPSRGYSMPLTSSWDEQLGQPIVSNGLPLTNIHHPAFDAHLISVAPDCESAWNKDPV